MYRQVIILRKDILKNKTGKAIAMGCHCSLAYFTKWIKNNIDKNYHIDAYIDKDIFDNWIKGSFVKTICEAKNKNHLLKVKTMANELGLVENIDYGLIYDNCLTELTPEEENGTTLTGIWFKPLPDEVAHKISKKYQLYKDYNESNKN